MKCLKLSRVDHYGRPVDGLTDLFRATFHSLEKLSLNDCFYLDTFKSINFKNIQVLNLSNAQVGFIRPLQFFQYICKSKKLTQLNLSDVNILEDWAKRGDYITWIDYLVMNLPVTMEKFSIRGNLGYYLKDNHVEVLVKRCKQLTELDLSGIKITNKSLSNIIDESRELVKLDISGKENGITKIMELKSMPKLKVLNISEKHLESHAQKENLTRKLPHLTINHDLDFNIADPEDW